MAMPAWVPEAWAKLNEDNQKHMSEYLQQVLSKQEADTKPVKPFPFGIMKGKIYVADNFDDPLPEFEEYM